MQLLCDTYWARQTKSVRVRYDQRQKRATEPGLMRTYRLECKPAQILGSSNSAIVLDLLKFSSLDRTSEQRAVSERIALLQPPCWRSRSPYNGRPRRDDPAVARYTRRSRSTTQTRDVIHVWRHKSQANLHSCVCMIFHSDHLPDQSWRCPPHSMCCPRPMPHTRTLPATTRPLLYISAHAQTTYSLELNFDEMVKRDKFRSDTCWYGSSANANMYVHAVQQQCFQT